MIFGINEFYEVIHEHTSYGIMGIINKKGYPLFWCATFFTLMDCKTSRIW